MSQLPDDLVPLPTQPWDERPDSIPLDVDEVRTALWLSRGNITEAAVRLKVPSHRLRKFVKRSQYLMAESEEARQQLLDMSESIAYEALTDPDDPTRRDGMAKFVLTKLGRTRGYGDGAGGVTVNMPKGNMIISWADGSTLVGSEASASPPAVIEGEYTDVE